MFFVLSKVFFAIARPVHLLSLLLVIGLGLQWTSKRRTGILLVNLSAITLIFIAFSPLALWIEQPLEMRFPRPGQLDPAPDGIIILGGATEEEMEVRRPDMIALNDAAERLTEIPRLASLYPNARIIYTGGPGFLVFDVLPEAQNARRLFIQMGISADRIVLEDQSKTTWENATLTKAIINPQPNSRWLLVTSAYHMARSVGDFRAAGWPGIIAFPTDYRAPDPSFETVWRRPGIDNLAIIEVAAKEYFGLLGYWLSGRSSALFPAP